MTQDSLHADDRFIPVRESAKTIKSQKYLMKADKNNCKETNKQEKFDLCLKNSLLQTIKETKVFNYNSQQMGASQNVIPDLKCLYVSNCRTPQTSDFCQTKLKTRYVCSKAERILDAPNLMNDLSLNILHLSDNKMLAIGLSECVYLFNIETNAIEKLIDFSNEMKYVCSLQWCHTSNYLGIGTNDGYVYIWDVIKKQKIRQCQTKHSQNVNSLTWNAHILTSAGKDSFIFNNDVRILNSKISQFNFHKKEICVLKWNHKTQANQLVSTDKDNFVCIWENNHQKEKTEKPLFAINDYRDCFTNYERGVTGCDWCPWKSNLLATSAGKEGGNSYLRFYDTKIGECVNFINCNNEITRLIWNPFENEILTAHGSNKNELSLWKYPSLIKTHDLIGHTSPILHLTITPCGTKVITAAADETLRFWKVFQKKNPRQCLTTPGISKKSKATLNVNIR